MFKLKKNVVDNSVLTEDTDSFIIGERVWVGGTKPGQIAYIGETQFAPGEWAGVVLDQPIGKYFFRLPRCFVSSQTQPFPSKSLLLWSYNFPNMHINDLSCADEI